ncbi:UNKNOWN [Stylonychia lemnae]|uniref:Uncharacterized protein n=1 Tax=Stylonychia lemnae TaxID=5949 RepID=A0A078AM23_STYLE|nr:UNKNOWN [Stylonychia lemnae]|eukprot:CDW82921.1 UNKNOWN [Stylonychia lemnae]
MDIEFYRLGKKMIKISNKLTKNRILNFLNPKFWEEQYHQENESKLINTKSKNSKIEKIDNIKQQSQEDNSNTLEHKASAIYDQDDSDDDENIYQIDQLFDFIYYQESYMRNNNNQLQFEPNVRTIIGNFCSYLKTNYEAIYAGTVLMCLQDELEKQQASNENSKNHQLSFKEDFDRIKSTMTQCRFRMDISFLILLINSLKKQGKIIDGDEMSQEKFKHAIDDVFNKLIRRNFQQFQPDPEFFIFKHSKLDEDLVKELSTPIKGDKKSPINFSNDNVEDSLNYLVDLWGTKDSYSDSEDASDNIRKPNRDALKALGIEQIYDSGKRLLFKVNVVIRDCQGKKVVDQQLEKISDIFLKYDHLIQDVCSELVEKVKFMEEEKMIASKNKDAILKGLKMMYEMRDQSPKLDLDWNMKKQCDVRDIQSSIEIYFSFYTIPQYIGLIRDQDLDFLCQEKDEILVNDDDHEDLIRVTKLMDYLQYGDNTEKRIANEDIRFQDLYKPFNKKQLVKSIPYYFKRTSEADNSLFQKDYNVFYYDEIQRKLIYGILRRTYALMAQNLLEYATQIKPVDQLNVALVQKYMGSLLFNQRQLSRVVVMSNLGSKIKEQAIQILKEDLKSSKILNNLCITDKNHDIYIIKTQTEFQNFYLKHQLPDNEQVPFNYDQEEERSSIYREQSPYFRQISHLSKSTQDDFQIPFWLMFQIQDSDENNGEIRLNITYHLPRYKMHSFLNQQGIETEMNRTMQLISNRIRTILLLQIVRDTREMPQRLVLNDNSQRRGTIGSAISRIEFSKFQSYSMISTIKTQNRMENAKNLNERFLQNDSNHSPISTTKNTHMTTNLTETKNTQAQQNQQQSKNQTYTSRFKMRMEKFNKQKPENKEMTENNNNGNDKSVSANEDDSKRNLDQEIKVEEIPKPQQFKVNLMHEYSFPIEYHSIRIDEILKNFRHMLYMFTGVEGFNNLYVTKIGQNVLLIKFQGKQNQEPANTQKHQNQNSGRSFSNGNNVFIETHNFVNDEYINNNTPNQSQQMKNSVYNQGSTVNQFSKPSNQIIMEIYGAYPLNQQQMDPLVHQIESVIKKIIFERILQNSQLSTGQLSRDDLNYIQEADQKIFVLFPISDHILDKYALLRYLRQNLSRYLYSVTLKGDQASNTIQAQNTLNSAGVSSAGLNMNQSHSKLLINKQESFGVLPPTFLSEIQKVHRQSSVSSGDEAFLSNRQDPNQNIVQSESQQQESKILIQGAESQNSYSDNSSECQIQSQEKQIVFKPDDFLLLYNSKMTLGQSQKNKQIQDKMKIYTIESIFRAALATINLYVLNQLDEDIINLNDKDHLNLKVDYQDKLMKHVQKVFDTDLIQDEDEYNSKTLVGLHTFACQVQSCNSNYKSQLPLVYKYNKDSLEMEDNIATRHAEKFYLINNEFEIPLPHNKLANQKYLMIKMSILGSLYEELFIKNLILNVNQAFNELMIEHQITRSFNVFVQSDLLLNEAVTNLSHRNSYSQNFVDPNQLIEKKKTEKKTSHKSQFVQRVEKIENLIQQGKVTITNIVNEMEKIVYGDSNDFFITLIFCLITHYHQEFKSQIQKQRLILKEFKEDYGIVLVIELLNKTTNKKDKTIYFNISSELQVSQYEIIYKELKQYLSRTNTVLRNIHPTFKLVIASLKFNQDIFRSQDKRENIIYKQFQDQILQLDGLKPEPDRTMLDMTPGLKSYNDIKTQVHLNSKSTEEAIYFFKRNFILIISLQDQKLNMKSYNLDKRVLKQTQNIINNQLQWHNNRQDYFKKIVSQKLGTVYTLKDYYSSKYLIKESNIKNIFTADKFIYEEPSKIIEGKQVYQFKRQRGSRSRKRGPRGKQIHDEEQLMKQSQNVADQYLKSIESNFIVLKDLYKRVGIKNEGPDKKELPKERKSSQEIRKLASNKFKSALNRSGQKITEKIYQEDESNDGNRRRIGPKPVVSFQEFIKNKSMLDYLLKINKKTQLHLSSLYVISPSLSPSRMDKIICEKEKLSHKMRRKQNNNMSQKTSYDEKVCSIDVNDKILLSNPLFFHGTKIYRMMAGFFAKVQQSKRASIIYKQSDVNNATSEKPQSKKFALFQTQFKDLIQLVVGNKVIQGNDIPINIKLLINQSKLLFSNTTMLFFDKSIYSQKINLDILEDMNISFNDDKRTDSEYKKYKFRSKVNHSNTEIIPQSTYHFQSSNALLEDIKNLFFEGYTNFLVQKARAYKAYQGNLEISPQIMANVKSKRIITQTNFNNSTNSMRKQTYLEDNMIKVKKPQLHRVKKVSEDFSSVENFGNDRIMEVNSNSSILTSQNTRDEFQLQLFSRRNQERVLVSHQFNDCPDHNNLHSYIVRAKDDCIFIYELNYNNGLIRINVYGLEDILANFPKQILINFKNLNRKDLGKEKKREIVKEEMRLSTKLNTDSFNYDFHSIQIMNIIVNNEKQRKELNLTQYLNNLVSFYKTPPKYARNYVDTVILRIDLGFLNMIKDKEFMQYFMNKIENFGFSSFVLKHFASHKDELKSPLKRFQKDINQDNPFIGFFKSINAAQLQKNQKVVTMQSSNISGNQESQKQQKQSKNDQSQKHKKLQSRVYSMIETLEENKEEEVKRQMSIISDKEKYNIKSSKVLNKLKKKEQNPRYSKEYMTTKLQKQFLNQQRQNQQNNEDFQQVNFKKLFYVEMYDSNIHGEIGPQADTYKKVWNLECKKQELSDSQINIDNFSRDEDQETKNKQKTIIELVFYYICSEERSTEEKSKDLHNSAMNNIANQYLMDSKPKKNNERYQIKDVSIDMYTFINAFNECRKELIKDQLWTKFFDPPKINNKVLQLTDIQISDMLRFSYQYDLKLVEDRYRFFEFLRLMFPNGNYLYNKNSQMKVGIGKKENLLIYNPESKNFLVQIEYNHEGKEIQAFLIRKDDSKKANYKDTESYIGGYSQLQKQKAVISLEKDEMTLVKKLMNYFVFWLYKRAV